MVCSICVIYLNLCPVSIPKYPLPRECAWCPFPTYTNTSPNEYTFYIYLIYLIYIPIFPIYLSNTCNIAVQVHVLVFRSISTPPTPPPLSNNILSRCICTCTFDVRVFCSGFPSGSVTSERDTDTVTK